MLSGDNAIVIALACRASPDRQRRLGIIFSASGAIALRIAFTLIGNRLLGIPSLTLAGGVFVVVLAAKLPTQAPDTTEVDAHRTLMGAIISIIAADAIMSLDNVLALMLGLAKTCKKLKISFFDYLGARLGVPGPHIQTFATFVREAPS